MKQNNKTLLSLQEILTAVDGKLIFSDGKKSEDFFFDNVVTDSRNVKENSLFVPLVGEVQDGHIYIHQAINNGATVIFAATSWVEKNLEEVAAWSHLNVFLIQVENTLSALQDSAACYVKKFPKLIRIGITGSSGKTTTKEIAASIFSQYGNVICNEGNFNSETGLPLSVFRIREEHEIGIFEMGMNRVGEMSELANVLRPQYVIITNIGTAHIGILGSRDNIAIEKKSSCKFFNENCILCVNENDDYKDFLAKGNPGKTIFYGENLSFVKNVEDMGLEGTRFTIDNNQVNFKLYGKYNFLDALAVVALAKEIGVSSDKIAKGLESVKALFGRAQIVKNFLGKENCTLILDCYNANPDSMGEAVKFCGNLKISGNKYFLLGDMLELGESSKKDHENIGLLVLDFVKKDLQEKNCEKIEKSKIKAIFVGKEMEYAGNILENEISLNGLVESKKYLKDEGASYKKIAEYLKQNIKENDLILVKGSRGMALEVIVKEVEKLCQDIGGVND